MEISIKDPYGFIYITTNLINGKKYIGQRKFVDYGGKKWIDYLGSGKLLKEAIDKYGRDNFYREIVAIAYSKEELNNLEINFIKEHNATKDRNYYNITKGGDSGIGQKKGFTHSDETKALLSKIQKEKLNNGELVNPNPKGSSRPEISGEKHWNFGTHWSNETKQKMSHSHTGKTHSKETRQKISEINTGSGNPNYGNKWDKNQKQKASEYWKEYWSKTTDRPTATKVINLDTMEIFDSIKLAKEKYKKGDISACCRGITKKAGGYRWMYYDEYLQQNKVS